MVKASIVSLNVLAGVRLMRTAGVIELDRLVLDGPAFISSAGIATWLISFELIYPSSCHGPWAAVVCSTT